MQPGNIANHPDTAAAESLLALASSQKEPDCQSVSGLQRQISPPPEATVSIIAGPSSSFDPAPVRPPSSTISSRQTSPAPSDSVHSISVRDEYDSDYEEPKPKRSRTTGGKNKGRRSRSLYSKEQVECLWLVFDHHHYLVASEWEELGNALVMTPEQVKIWFQNRRTEYRRTHGSALPDKSSSQSFSELLKQVEEKFAPVKSRHTLKKEVKSEPRASSSRAEAAGSFHSHPGVAPEDTEPKYSEEYLRGYAKAVEYNAVYAFQQGFQTGLNFQFSPYYVQVLPADQQGEASQSRPPPPDTPE